MSKVPKLAFRTHAYMHSIIRMRDHARPIVFYCLFCQKHSSLYWDKCVCGSCELCFVYASKIQNGTLRYRESRA